MKNGDGLYEYDYQTRVYTYPDVLNFDREPFATVIPSRSVSTFKVHKTEGLANSALSHHKQGAKYKQENGVWVKVWEHNSNPTNCESCNAGLDPDRDKTGGPYNYSKEWLRSPLHKGAAIFAPYRCRVCFEAEQEVVNDRKKAREWRAEQKRRETFDAQFKN